MKITFEINSVKELNELRDLLNKLKPSILHKSDFQLLDLSGLTINEMAIDERARNCLRYLKVLTVKQLVELTSNDLLKTPNLGRKSFNQIVYALALGGLKLKET